MEQLWHQWYCEGQVKECTLWDICIWNIFYVSIVMLRGEVAWLLFNNTCINPSDILCLDTISKGPYVLPFEDVCLLGYKYFHNLHNFIKYLIGKQYKPLVSVFDKFIQHTRDSFSCHNLFALMCPSDAGLEWPQEYGRHDIWPMGTMIGEILVHPATSAQMSSTAATPHVGS